jgi:hypothetical protein
MRAVSPVLSLLVAFLIVDSAESQTPTQLTTASQVQCSLSTSTALFTFNRTAGVYVEVAEDDPSYGSFKSGNRRLRPTHGIATQIDNAAENDTDNIHHVKSCWCTQFFDRPMEYCPTNFDTCVVRGANGAVSCYSTSGAATFVKGFWPVALFWLLALCYGVFFTEPGGSFRDYVRRTVCLPCASKSSEELLRQDVDRLVEGQPERAVFLYRKALLRQRRLSDRQELHAQIAQIASGHPRTPSDNLPTPDILPVASPVAVEAAAAAHDPELATVRTLKLKTKVFMNSSSEDAAQQQPAGPIQIQRSHVPQSTRSPNWLPSQFTREHVTLDEMDDELEQGVRCAICLDRLAQGDVVGDIPCEHVFHKDCLKDWLKKKNRCPLCQRDEVATPNFQSMPLDDRAGATR